MMGRVHIPIFKDGFVKASQMAEVLESIAEAVAERCTAIEERCEALEVEVRRLSRDAETERRLLLAMKR